LKSIVEICFVASGMTACAALECRSGLYDGGGDTRGRQEQRQTGEFSDFGKVGALFFACVQKHDDEDERTMMAPP